MTGRRPRDRGRLPTAATRWRLAGCLWLLWAAPCAAQSTWEFTPYRVQVWLATAELPSLPAATLPALPAALVARSETTIGAAWDLQAAYAEPSWAWRLATQPESISPEHLPDPLGWDKIMLVSLAGTPAGPRLLVREYDVRCREFTGRALQERVPLDNLVDGCLRALWQAFCPLAEIDTVDGKTAKLTLRAAGFQPRDKNLSLASRSGLYRPVVRYIQRDGSLKAVRPIDWTYLLAESSEGAKLTCQIHTGLRGPLSERRRGRIEKLALAVPVVHGNTQLVLRSTTEPKPPRVGYEVLGYAADNRATTLLGKTDRHGQLTIEPAHSPLRLLLAMNGSQLLAKLPIVPGLYPRLEAFVPDDDPRLEAEGFVSGLQEAMVDLVVRREVLINQTKQEIEAGNVQEAQSLMEQLRRMPTRQQFAFRLQQEEQRLVPADLRNRRRVERLFEDTRTILSRYLDPRAVELLEGSLVRLRSAPPAETAPPAAAGSPTPPATPAGDTPPTAGTAPPAEPAPAEAAPPAAGTTNPPPPATSG